MQKVTFNLNNFILRFHYFKNGTTIVFFYLQIKADLFQRKSFLFENIYMRQ